jgi:hypothetical protein
VVETLQTLGLRVRAGDLGLDEFYRALPEAPDDPFLGRVYSDYEDAIEHTPSRAFGGVDDDAWRRSPEYAIVALDIVLLRDWSEDQPSSALLAARNAVAAEIPAGADESAIADHVARLLSKPRADRSP